ncbi:RsfA family transcriptional regulator [Bacillus sp. 165]|uniref:RsfA family transcriptional regulator n=1 Tax=Bacillus sp. 165 TaxID=1529117 RepID=UPI001AD9F021|nr:RsfA family transcriptional regulator [Bacillus sp. 165]MBO9130275.1 RsfA family transcriptional regulator [Bacillus sp. 165]
MATTRQDAWTDEEDLLLAEVVLRHIKEGGTQLLAFKEVGRHLSRTPAACGFRWNSYVRKQYKAHIEEAKQLRKEAIVREEPVKQSVNNQSSDSITLSQVVAFLQKLEEQTNENTLHAQIEKLEQEKQFLLNEKEELLTKLELLEEEYRTLFDYIDRKRNVVVLESSEREKKVQLLRERNVLEKIEK